MLLWEMSLSQRPKNEHKYINAFLAGINETSTVCCARRLRFQILAVLREDSQNLLQQHIGSVLLLWSAGLHLMFRSDPDVDPFHCSSERGQLSHPFPESWGSSELWLFDYATWSSAGLSGWGSLNFPPCRAPRNAPHVSIGETGRILNGRLSAAGMCLLAKPCCWFRFFCRCNSVGSSAPLLS